MLKFGDIILVPFPFTDLKSSKVRPAVIVSRDARPGDDVVVCFLTSTQKTGKNSVKIANNVETGLKTPSLLRFDKILTLEKKEILGKIGQVDRKFLQKNQGKFYGVFGF